jgi:hypothetical protein
VKPAYISTKEKKYFWHCHVILPYTTQKNILQRLSINIYYTALILIKLVLKLIQSMPISPLHTEEWLDVLTFT